MTCAIGVEYCDKYDAHYVADTGEWTEISCSDLFCEFCEKRPEEHSNECQCQEMWNERRSET